MLSSRATVFRPLRERDFRLVWTGDAVSVLGDQFYIVALPWLILGLTGSGLAVGTTLMLTAVPRATLMLLGGAVSDRYSPRRILVAASAVRAVLVGLIGWLAWAGVVRMPHLYVTVFLFGVADSFAYPAFTTLVPLIVSAEMLAAANGLLYAAAYVCLLVGPALGGVLVASGGLPLAFVLDAASFLFAAALLLLVRAPAAWRAAVPAGGDQAIHRAVASDIVDGLRAAWNDHPLRAVILLIAVVNLAFAGPYTVGLSVLAKTVFRSPAALGAMFSAFGGGALVGSLLGGSIGRSVQLDHRILAPCLVFSMAFPLLGIAWTLPLAAALACTLGLAGGFINVLLMSWLQRRAPSALLGRIMGLVMFASFGLQPVSYAIAGVLVDRHLHATFLGAGLLMMAAIGWTMASGALAGMREPQES